jgi:hypothetical protein
MNNKMRVKIFFLLIILIKFKIITINKDFRENCISLGPVFGPLSFLEECLFKIQTMLINGRKNDPI